MQCALLHLLYSYKLLIIITRLAKAFPLGPLSGLISLNDWSSAVGQVLHLELPWRMLHSQLLTSTTNDMLDYHNWFRNLSIKEPNCEVK